MKKRSVLIALSWALCAGTVLGVLMQRQELIAMRSQRDQLAVGLPKANQRSQPEVDNGNKFNSADDSTATDSPELLQLRSEITRLTAKKHELAAVPEEAAKLRAQIDGSPASSQGGIRVPPGYIRKSEAQFVGYSTPESTIQSFLAALQHHDATNMLQALTPDDARELSATMQRQGEKEFFKGMDSSPPGMLVRNRQDLPDGSVELEVEFIPGMPTDKLHLKAFDGEWKLEGRF